MSPNKLIYDIFFKKKYDRDPTIFSYMKVYPDHAKFIEYDNPYNPHAYYDPSVDSALPSRQLSGNRTLEQAEQAYTDSLRRSKTNISDIVLSNKFDMWCTFTFNGKKENEKKLGLRATTDRHDVLLCKQKMSKWLDNQRIIHGSFDYLIVAEYHKNGALHFHAFFNNYKGKISQTTKVYHGKPVYKITSYKLGISDMQYIEQDETDYRKISSYIKKYITKDMPLFSGKKRYWCSSGLTRPDIIKNPTSELMEKYKFELRKKLERLTLYHGTAIVQKSNNNQRETNG